MRKDFPGVYRYLRRDVSDLREESLSSFGPGASVCGPGRAYSGLASNNNLLPSQTREYWQEAHFACQNSLSVWNDKERRGEMESGERESLREVAQCVADTGAQLRGPAPKQASLHGRL